MKLQRILGLALLIAAAAAFAMTSMAIALPVGLCLLAAIGASGRVAIKLPIRPVLVAAILAVVFLAIQRVSPFNDPAVRGFLFYDIAYPVGQFLLTWMAVQFVIRQPKGLPASLPLYAVGVMICAGDVLMMPTQESYYQCLAVAIVAIAMFYFIYSRRVCPSPSHIGIVSGAGRLAILLLTVMACLVGSWISIGHLRRHESELNLLFEQMLSLRSRLTEIGYSTGSQVGFSQNTKLQSVNNIKKSGNAEVMLRVFSQIQPGYLRAEVYDTYSDSQWKTSTISETASPNLDAGMEPTGPGQLFVLTPVPQGQACQKLEVWSSPSIAGPIFAPLGISAIRSSTDKLTVNDHLAARSLQLAGGLNYRLVVSQTGCEMTGAVSAGPSTQASDDLRTLCLQLPPKIDERVVALAKELFVGCDSPASRIAAVERYFHDNYEYSLNMTVPEGQDPLTYFILSKPPAHCEFFASAAAVLLRLGGVPARYVTGFVADNHNNQGNYWLATNNDAHAWVEAWDDTPSPTLAAGQVGHWVIVEATPASGVPSNSSTPWLQDLWDFIRFRLLQLRVALELDGFKGLLVWLWDQLAGLVGLLTTTATGLAILAIMMGLLAWRYRPGKGKRRVKLSPHILRQHRLLAKMDRRARRLGLIRRQAETLHQFAARIRLQTPTAEKAQDMATWYEDYAASKYGLTVRSPEHS